MTTHYGSKETYEYKAEGNFPCGTYTREWIYYDYNNTYSQTQIVLKMTILTKVIGEKQIQKLKKIIQNGTPVRQVPTNLQVTKLMEAA